MRAIVAVVCIAALCAGAVNAVGVERIKHRAAALRAASEAEAEAETQAAEAEVDQGVVIDSAFGLYTVSIAEQALTPCKGTKGMCMDVNKYTCGGTGGKLVSGKCAGDKSILCCTGTPVEKPSSVAARVPTDPFPVTPVPPQPAVADRAVAFKATLTPAGIATLNKLVNSVLKKQLAKPIVIPDQALSMDKFALNVKNLVISSVAVGPVAIDVAPPATISASVSGGNAQADTDFAWTRTGLLRVSGSGHLTVTFADLAVKFGLSVTTTSSSKLQIQMTSSSVTIDKLNFKFSQSWDSFVLNAITGLFQSQLKPMIQTQISQGVAPFNAQIKAILDGLPQSTTFGAGEMSCTLRIGFETVTAGTDGLTLGESLAVDCN